MADFNIFNQFPKKAQHALIGWMAGWRARPIIAPPNMWWKGRVLEYANSKVEERVPLPVHAPKVRPYQGSAEFDDLSGVFMSVRRKPRQIGTRAKVIELAEFDYKGWSLAPDSMAIAIGNIPGNDAGNLLGGNAAEGVISARANTKWWCGDNNGARFACLSGDANKIPVNPFNPKILSRASGLATWFNAHENFAIDPDNIIAAIKNLQIRPGFDGMPLDMGRENLEMWVPSLSQEEARILVEVMRTLAKSGWGVDPIKIDYLVDTGGSPQTNQQVVFGNQENPVFGRVKVVPVPQLRSDMWCIVNPTTIPGTEIFLRALGGSVGSYEVNDMATAEQDNDKVPHIWTVVHGEQSPMFYNHQSIGIWNLVNEGMDLASPYAIEFCYTGSAS